MAFNDLNEHGQYWTVALVTEGREVHFGVFKIEDAIKAKDSGLVTTLPGERVVLRGIRAFPTK